MTLKDRIIGILIQISLPAETAYQIAKHLPDDINNFAEAREIINQQLQRLDVPNPEVITKKFNDYADKLQNS